MLESVLDLHANHLIASYTLMVSIQKKGTFTGWQSAIITKADTRSYFEELFKKISKEISS